MEAAALAALQSAGGLSAEGEDFQSGSSGEEGYDSEDQSSEGGDAGGLLGEEASSSEDEGGASGEEEEEDLDAGLESPGGGSDGEAAAPGAPGAQAAARASKGAERADAFARAFSKIVGGAGASGAPAAAAAAAGEAPILAASKSIAKRKADEAEEQRADRESKLLRLEMRQRGHVAASRRGEDPAADAREKGFQKVATRGVVRLFNAVAKAQKQLRAAADASGTRGAKAVKAGKASFLAELRAGAAAGGRPGEAMVASAPGQAVAGRPAQQQQQQQQRRRGQQSAEADSSGDEEGGWDVLQEGFTGLQGGNKMKDWDRAGEESESGGEPADSEDGGSGSGEEGW